MMAESPLTATMLSRYIRLDRCGRYLHFALHKQEAKAMQARYRATIEPLSPLLAESGGAFEAAVIAALPIPARDIGNRGVAGTLAEIRAILPGSEAFLTQAVLEGTIGPRQCVGKADIMRVVRQAEGTLDVAIVDVKATTHDRVEYRLQVAFYARLLTDMLVAAGERVATVQTAILTQPEDGRIPAYDEPAAQFDAAPYALILDQLLIGADAEITSVLAMPVESVPFALEPKCDACSFNQLCMRDSAQRQDVALVPAIRAADIQALKQQGVATLRDLVALKELPPPNQFRRAFAPGPGQAATLAALQHNPAIAPKLDRLVQRARAILHRFDPTVTTYSYLLDGSHSQLPAAEENPDLVRIFLDAQSDYLQDRIYLAGALIIGPRGQRVATHMTEGPPTTASEAQLLMALLGAIVTALPEVAAEPAAMPLHLYLYDRFEQGVWLDALTRHLDQLSSVPAFFDLLTANPAVDQEPLLAFLAQEIHDRKNLGIVCQNLYSVATNLKFPWQDETFDFRKTFHDRVFDRAERRGDGVWIESRSQFNSHIPLEYAYGAWGRLPADAGNSRNTWRYRQCTRAALLAFEARRLQAMVHIADWLAPAHARLVKLPRAITSITTDQPVPDRARALEEFLGTEHHASLQQTLDLFLLPFERRAQTGRCLPLRCVRVAADLKTAEFVMDFAAVGLEGDLARHGLQIKEGDWMVLNDMEHQTPWELIKGRLTIIKGMAGATVTLDLSSLTSRESAFKYSHNIKLLPAPGDLYTLDEMVDDLNADKFLQAVRHSAGNLLFDALNASVASECLPQFSSRGELFLKLATKHIPKFQVTERQAEVVAACDDLPIVCVQGPPGTGKTATVGWAILERIFRRTDQRLRVLVCAKTHKATNLVLASVANCLDQCAVMKIGQAISPMAIHKIVNSLSDEVPEHVSRLLANSPTRLREEWEHHAVIVGGTPGGIFNLMKAIGHKQVDWGNQPFDLLVIDEASQMSLPEALLAGAFVQPAGQILIVGDHRQMPPILAHPWQQECKRTATTYHPAHSIFEALMERTPVVKLDESFRLHQVQAGFLATHIYQADQLAYFSKRTDLLTTSATVADPFAAAVLEAAYPIVVIEHGERGSQQFNQTELDLVSPIVQACLDALQLEGKEGLGIVVPHNAQKAALRKRFPALDADGAIDTVERFQGGERDVIIVTATASDPGYILAEADFLLNRNRLNVAFSRARKKLIVLASTALFRFLCSDLAQFDQALLWKHLRHSCTDTLLWQGSRANTAVSV